MTQSPHLTLYYDGLCILCSKEMDLYRRQDKKQILSFVDISNPEFKAEDLGLDPVAVNRHFHVQKSDSNKFLIGMEAFIEIWKFLPGWKRIVPIASFPPILWVLKQFYKLFVVARPYLPRKDACEGGTCQL